MDSAARTIGCTAASAKQPVAATSPAVADASHVAATTNTATDAFHSGLNPTTGFTRFQILVVVWRRFRVRLELAQPHTDETSTRWTQALSGQPGTGSCRICSTRSGTQRATVAGCGWLRQRVSTVACQWTVNRYRGQQSQRLRCVRQTGSLDSAQAYPVRQFYIPAFGSFTLKKVTAGSYDVRYRDLGSGGLSRSEALTLSEVHTDEGTRFSNVTMTLYKVKNGNMKTFGLAEAEF